MLVFDGAGKPWRMHTRARYFYNLQALPIMMADSLVADTVATIASLDPGSENPVKLLVRSCNWS